MECVERRTTCNLTALNLLAVGDLDSTTQLRFRRTDARHDAIEVDQSDGFILSCGFLHAHLRMIPPPALSGAKPLFNMDSRLMKAVERMFERCCVEHGPTPTQAML